ncbi:hypothetical protein BGW41_000981 [Actinomortierella wolfii]|nr:hypothetical protein BGW41_000981 [Actinomortierella wolfii]
MLNILDLFPHGPSTTVPEQLRLGCVSAVASTLFVNLPLKYALQYGLNTLEREQQAEQTILDRSPSLLPGSVPPFPSVWVFGRSQQALLDLLSADTHLHSRLGENTDGHHPWNHFERNSSEFRPDLWARMAFHYCPTLLHLEAFFVCIHLNQTLIQQQQRNKQQGQHEKEGLPLVIILAGFFNLDAVNKDLSPTSSSSAAPYPPPTHISGLTETDASAAASDGSPYRAHLKLVSLVMSEIKDAIQWIEKSL